MWIAKFPTVRCGLCRVDDNFRIFSSLQMLSKYLKRHGKKQKATVWFISAEVNTEGSLGVSFKQRSLIRLIGVSLGEEIDGKQGARVTRLCCFVCNKLQIRPGILIPNVILIKMFLHF